VGFTVTAGEVVALLGPSGAGKTTLFRCLTRLVEADQGEIRLLGRSIRECDRANCALPAATSASCSSSII
jgi:phosphonate transport system ATP-binding protein